MRELCSFFVAGDPKPKGSWKALMIGGRPRLIPDNKRSAPWQRAISVMARHVYHEKPANCAVKVVAIFCMPRPKNHYRTGKNSHVLKESSPEYPSIKGKGGGDSDKLMRAVLDALEGIVYANDAQVTDIQSSKRYVLTDESTGPGVYIEVFGLE